MDGWMDKKMKKMVGWMVDGWMDRKKKKKIEKKWMVGWIKNRWMVGWIKKYGWLDG